MSDDEAAAEQALAQYRRMLERAARTLRDVLLDEDRDTEPELAPEPCP
jgi:hypothetical protein